jgi:putative permease
MTMKKVALYAAVIMGTLALLYLMWVFRQALVLFVFSLAITAATRPFVERLSERRVPRTPALILVYTIIIGAIVALFWVVGSPLLSELQQITDNLARSYDRIWQEWPEGTELQRTIVQQLPAPAVLYEQFSPTQQNAAIAGLLGFTTVSATFIWQVVTIMILSIYWSVDRVHFERLWLSLLPVESRARARDVWRNIERDFGAYARSEVLQAALAGIMLGIGLSIIGIPFPTLLAFVGALAWLIPWLGGLLAILPIALVGLGFDLVPGIIATVYAMALFFLLEFVIEPRFFRRRQFSSLLSILLIIALIEPFGLIGFIVAPPLAAAIELIFRYNLQTRQQPQRMEAAQQISELRGRLLSIREHADTIEQIEPSMDNMLERLESLLERADNLVSKERKVSTPTQAIRPDS